MKAKIAVAIGLATAVLCFIGILITGWDYLSMFIGVAVGVSLLLFLLVLYIIALLLKKRKMIWFVISAWVLLWFVGFFMGILNNKGYFNADFFIITILDWPSFVCENFFGHSEFSVFLDSLIGISCSFILIVILLCTGALGLRQSKSANKSSEEVLTETKEI